MKAKIFFDGGARPTNPGPAAGAAVVMPYQGEVLQAARYLGVRTNNFAEYAGLSLGLEMAIEAHLFDVEIFTDSQLVEGHLAKGWKINADNLRLPIDFVRSQLALLTSFSICSVPRKKNSLADRLATECIKARRDLPCGQTF